MEGNDRGKHNFPGGHYRVMMICYCESSDKIQHPSPQCIPSTDFILLVCSCTSASTLDTPCYGMSRDSCTIPRNSSPNSPTKAMKSAMLIRMRWVNILAILLTNLDESLVSLTYKHFFRLTQSRLHYFATQADILGMVP
ncbi:hypothetical protein ECG_09192 [Echinococcus granulosus]|nr:hypothetical protein ECG_09192 [Echinococcus granulosus]